MSHAQVGGCWKGEGEGRRFNTYITYQHFLCCDEVENSVPSYERPDRGGVNTDDM